jgi:hypothetical protein
MFLSTTTWKRVGGVEVKTLDGGQSPVLFFFSFSGWGETESTWYVGQCWPIVPAPDDRWWNDDWQGKPKYSEKICPSATLSTTNPTWPDLGSNPGRRGGKPATNSLSYGTAISRQINPPATLFPGERPRYLSDRSLMDPKASINPSATIKIPVPFRNRTAIVQQRKVKVSLYLIKHHAMKTYWGVEV